MLLKMFSVYDSKVGAYMKPFYLRSAAEAIREMTDAIVEPKCVFYKHPEDYCLFEVGTFDELTGDFNIYEARVSLGSLIEFKPNTGDEVSSLKAVS